MTECLVKSEVVERLKHIIATRRGAEAFMAQRLLEWIENEANVVVIEENRNEKKKANKNHRQVGKPRGATYADVLAYQRKKDEAIERAAQSAVTKVTSNQQAQRVQWIDIIAAHEAFGIGPERFEKFFECAIAISNEVERMRAEVDDEYAWEKLRERAAKVSGINFSYVYEGEYKP